MKISVRVFGILKNYLEEGKDEVTLDVKKGATVNDVVRQLGVDERAVWGASINGKWADSTTHLSDGIEVLIFPPESGG